MPIGNCYKYLAKNKISYIITNIFGTLDLHTHIRLKPLVNFLGNKLKENLNYMIIEIGCGCGVNAFELSKIKNCNFNYIGYDVNEDCIDVANELSKKLNLFDHIKFVNADATNYPFEETDHFVDVVLLIDFLEHIENPIGFLNRLKPKLKKDSLIIVSVPTPNYPKVFGKTFHKKIGHVIDGYTYDDLIMLFKEVNGELIYHKYNTGLVSNLGCAIYYRKPINIRYVNTLKSIILYPFKFLDFYNTATTSSSLFAVFKINERIVS